MEQGVSVVLCCYNSSSRIGETLRHLSLQQTPAGFRWEIILVDNASTDDTKDKAQNLWKEFSRTNVQLKIVDQPIQGLSFARAKGIELSCYSIIIFCDDDNWLQHDYVIESYSIINSNPQIGALGGVGSPVSDNSLPEWFDKYKFTFACYRQGISDGELMGATPSLYGAGMVIRRDVISLLHSRKFQPILTDRIGSKLMAGGDTELCYAILLVGYKLWFSERLKFFHYLPSVRLTEKYLIRLNKSLSYCSGGLITYRYVLQGKVVNRYIWLKDTLYQLFLFFNSLIRILNFRTSIFERRLDLTFSFNSLKSIFSQFGKYRVQYQQIIKLRS